MKILRLTESDLFPANNYRTYQIDVKEVEKLIKQTHYLVISRVALDIVSRTMSHAQEIKSSD